MIYDWPRMMTRTNATRYLDMTAGEFDNAVAAYMTAPASAWGARNRAITGKQIRKTGIFTNENSVIS